MTAFLQDSMAMYKSEGKCMMSTGAKCTIASTVFWFIAGIPVLKIGTPPVYAVEAGKDVESKEAAIDPDSKLFDNEIAAADEEISHKHSEEHTLETTEEA